MEVLQNCMVVAILGKGDLVGCDIPSTLTSEARIKSSGDVKALTYCDLKSIHIPELLDVLKLYPEFSETFCNEIVHDLTFNLREGYENEHESGLQTALSVTLPSISEDDENNENDKENNENVDEIYNENSSLSSSHSSNFKVINQNNDQNQWSLIDNCLEVNQIPNNISNQTKPSLCYSNSNLKV